MPRPTANRAFTLIELVASMVIIGTVASVAVPLIGSASDAFVTASDNRNDIEQISHAMDRTIRMIRQAPATAPGSGLLDVSAATVGNVEFADGSEIELTGSALMLTPAGGVASVLCTGVTAFELTYLAEDGLTDTIGAPQNTQRIEIRIAANGQELRAAVFVRIATGSPAP